MSQMIEDLYHRARRFNPGLGYKSLQVFSTRWTEENAVVVFRNSNKEIDGCKYYMTPVVEKALEEAEYFKTEAGAPVAARLNNAIFILTQNEDLVSEFFFDNLIGDENAELAAEAKEFLKGIMHRDIGAIKETISRYRQIAEDQSSSADLMFNELQMIKHYLDNPEEVRNFAKNVPPFLKNAYLAGTTTDISSYVYDEETLEQFMEFFTDRFKRRQLSLTRDMEAYIREYNKFLDAAISKEVALKKMEDNSEISVSEVQSLLGFLEKSSIIESFEFYEGSMRIYTKQIVIPHDDNEYAIGPFRLDMNETGQVKLFRGEGAPLAREYYYHPQVNGSGSICMGRQLGDMYERFRGHSNIISMLECCFIIIQHYNPGDAYCPLPLFPRTDGTRIEE